MDNAKATCRKKLDVLKEWYSRHEINTHIRMLAFCAITFLWTYLMTGSSKASFIYLASGILASAFEFLIFKKPTDDKIKTRNRNIYRIAFLVIISALAFGITLSVTNALTALISSVTWICLYITHAKAKRIGEWTLGAILPLFILSWVEYLQSNLLLAYKYMFQTYNAVRLGYAISILLISFVTCFFANLLNSKKIAYYVTGAIFGLLGFVNFFVLSITEQPFTLSDIKIATTAAGVLKTQALSFEDWTRFGLGVLILGAYFVIISFAYKFEKLRSSLRSRIIPYISVCLIAVAFFFTSVTMGSNALLYQGHIKYGFIGNFYITLTNELRLPSDAADYVIDDKNDSADYTPNVIIIMNEAFSDLGETFNLELSEDPLSYFHSLQKQYPCGITYSSVKGNNTCSSEWELLSSSPTALTAKGAAIYKDYANPMRSVVSIFNSRGYTTLGLHPYYAHGYNRSNVYQNLGFDQSVFIEDMPQGLEEKRGFITDEENYKYLIEQYEKNEAAGNSPFFCFNITMQNHGGYRNMQSNDVYVKGDKTYSDVNTYLSVLRYSDDALKMLLEYFENVEEDTVVLIFGDHQPMIDNVFYEDIFGKKYSELTLDQIQKIYATPYLIWANYDLNEDAAPSETSNCYLTNVLFDVGGIPKTSWLNMVDSYQTAYPVITSVFTVDEQGNLWETPALLNERKKLADDPLTKYQKYSFGILYGIK